MNKFFLLGTIIFIFVGFTQNAYAERERVLTCPNDVPGYQGTHLTFSRNNLNYSLVMSELKSARVIKLTRSIICSYDKVSLSIEVPANFSARTCSFDKNSAEPKITCESNDPDKCVLYCQRR